ncbi:hypothetical protein QTO34_014691 [Cnephaeus nilssonii]|uniref:Uncharacterized protein n=1 Tax=Cnephaeus nilssonii TaxID=3371016 RepID=A0AA40LS51_CNENI|nr:hypothetical protein QTO34_014691 [Eptesicus nilssonii]
MINVIDVSAIYNFSELIVTQAQGSPITPNLLDIIGVKQVVAEYYKTLSLQSTCVYGDVASKGPQCNLERGQKRKNGVYSSVNYIRALKVILCLLAYRLVLGLVIQQRLIRMVMVALSNMKLMFQDAELALPAATQAQRLHYGCAAAQTGLWGSEPSRRFGGLEAAGGGRAVGGRRSSPGRSLAAVGPQEHVAAAPAFLGGRHRQDPGLGSGRRRTTPPPRLALGAQGLRSCRPADRQLTLAELPRAGRDAYVIAMAMMQAFCTAPATSGLWAAWEGRKAALGWSEVEKHAN